VAATATWTTIGPAVAPGWTTTTTGTSHGEFAAMTTTIGPDVRDETITTMMTMARVPPGARMSARAGAARGWGSTWW
jgi:hypothetical protein